MPPTDRPGQPGASVASSHAPAFIPVKLPPVMHEPQVPELKVELRNGALLVTVTRPLGAVADFAQWAMAVLK